MYRHGRLDVVCVVSSEFLFLLPPFFAAPAIFLSHPCLLFPRFFLSLFAARSPTYARVGFNCYELRRFHALDTINDNRPHPTSFSRVEHRPNDRPFGSRKHEVAPTYSTPGEKPRRKTNKGFRRRKREKGKRGCIGGSRSDRGRNLFPIGPIAGWLPSQRTNRPFHALPFLSLFHRSTLTFIGRVFGGIPTVFRGTPA